MSKKIELGSKYENFAGNLFINPFENLKINDPAYPLFILLAFENDDISDGIHDLERNYSGIQTRYSVTCLEQAHNLYAHLHQESRKFEISTLVRYQDIIDLKHKKLVKKFNELPLLKITFPFSKDISSILTKLYYSLEFRLEQAEIKKILQYIDPTEIRTSNTLDGSLLPIISRIHKDLRENPDSKVHQQRFSLLISAIHAVRPDINLSVLGVAPVTREHVDGLVINRKFVKSDEQLQKHTVTNANMDMPPYALRSILETRKKALVRIARLYGYPMKTRKTLLQMQEVNSASIWTYANRRNELHILLSAIAAICPDINLQEYEISK